MCWRHRQAGERQRQIKDDGFILDGCWAWSSCWPFCLSLGHSTARLRAVGSTAFGLFFGFKDHTVPAPEDGTVLCKSQVPACRTCPPLPLPAPVPSFPSPGGPGGGGGGGAWGGGWGEWGCAHFPKIGDGIFLSGFSCSLGCGITDRVGLDTF